MKSTRRIITSAACATLLSCSLHAGFYSTDQTVFDSGGGLAGSEHYSASTSLGIGFFGDSAEAPSGDVVTPGFIGAFNEAPAALPDTFPRVPGQPVTIQIANLLANDHDVEGDPVTLVSISSTSTLGVPITVQGTSVTYNSVSQQPGIDSLTYFVTDGIGGTSQGTVFVTGGGPVLVVQQTGNSLRLSFLGVAGISYQIQIADSLAPAAWRSGGNITAGADGSVVFTDLLAPGVSTRFYRAVQP